MVNYKHSEICLMYAGYLWDVRKIFVFVPTWCRKQSALLMGTFRIFAEMLHLYVV